MLYNVSHLRVFFLYNEQMRHLQLNILGNSFNNTFFFNVPLRKEYTTDALVSSSSISTKFPGQILNRNRSTLGST